MKIDVVITNVGSHTLHDGELVTVTGEGGGVVVNAQTKDPAIGAAWKKEWEEGKAAAAAAAKADAKAKK